VTLAPVIIAALVFAGVWAVSDALLPSPLAVRARQMFGGAVAVAAPATRAVWLDRAALWLAQMLGSTRLAEAETRARLAGWQAPAAGARLVAATVVLPLLLPLFGLPFVLWRTDDPVQRAAMLLLLAIAGRVGPGLFVANMAERRRQAIADALPDAIDLLVICAEAGLSLDQALARTARELAPAQPVLAGELALTAIELGFLPRRADAFDNLARRVPIPQVQTLTDMLVQTERFGTPLAHALRIMAGEYRGGRLLRAEARAARLPALMTVPMIAFILPPLFVVLIGPAVVEAMG
jgi:tight adherence protein C